MGIEGEEIAVDVDGDSEDWTSGMEVAPFNMWLWLFDEVIALAADLGTPYFTPVVMMRSVSEQW